MLTWARRRQLSYLFGLTAFFGLVGLTTFLIYRPAPTCFDGRQNQDETGLDCGGQCSTACVNEVSPLKVHWVRSLPISPGRYDLVALVENVNRDFGVRRQAYRFALYDKDNVLLTERFGETFVNPGEQFVIFESRLETEDREIGRAFLEFVESGQWEKISPVARTIELERRDSVAQPKPLLHFSAANNGLAPVVNLEVVAVLSDINRNAFAASATVVDRLAPAQRRDLYFTWPDPFDSEPSYVDAYWRLNRFEVGE